MIRVMLVVRILVVTGSTAAFAEAAGYKCTIKHSINLGDDGLPKQLKPDSFNYYRNQEFVVDRASGRILGNVIRTEGSQREVLDSGSEHWSYKLTYSFPSPPSPPPHAHVNLLQVREYQAGAVKPFLLVESDTMHMGTCTHLQ
jgi:hypothetical protein